MPVLRTVLFVVGALGALSSVPAAEGRVRSTKIIFHGWDTIDATPSDILANSGEFAKIGIDGVTLCLVATTPDGKRLSFDRIMNDPPWTEADFSGQIPVLRKIAQSPSLGESLLSSRWSPPKRLAWTDDAAWGVFAANMGVMAAIARKAGWQERHSQTMMTTPSESGSAHSCAVSSVSSSSAHVCRTDRRYAG